MMGARSSSKGSASMGHEPVLLNIGRVIAGATEVRCAKLIELCSPSSLRSQSVQIVGNESRSHDENNSPLQKGAARSVAQRLGVVRSALQPVKTNPQGFTGVHDRCREAFFLLFKGDFQRSV